MSAEDDQTHAAPARYVVVRGGEPTPEQLAALTVALTPVTVDDGTETGPDRPAAWVRAALMENVGRRPLVSADDLQAAPPLFA